MTKPKKGKGGRRDRRGKKGKKIPEKTILSRFNDSFSEKKPILKFVLTFGLGIILFYSVYFSDFFTNTILQPIIAGQASLSSFLLNMFGYDTEVSNTLLSSGGVVLDIKKGCDGIEPTFFFLIGVFLVPFTKKAKSVGLVIGLVVLSILNIVRILGLFLASYHWPESFDFLHLHGGFTLFFIVTLLVWIIWANWAIRQSTTPTYDKGIS